MSPSLVDWVWLVCSMPVPLLMVLNGNKVQSPLSQKIIREICHYSGSEWRDAVQSYFGCWGFISVGMLVRSALVRPCYTWDFWKRGCRGRQVSNYLKVGWCAPLLIHQSVRKKSGGNRGNFKPPFSAIWGQSDDFSCWWCYVSKQMPTLTGVCCFWVGIWSADILSWGQTPFDGFSTKFFFQ